jgi:hypothetical protein
MMVVAADRVSVQVVLVFVGIRRSGDGWPRAAASLSDVAPGTQHTRCRRMVPCSTTPTSNFVLAFKIECYDERIVSQDSTFKAS